MSSQGWLRFGALFGAVLVFGCTDEVFSNENDQSKVRDVPVTEDWAFPALRSEVHVIRTEANIPHIYAENSHDVAYVLGFVQARDRFFMMDLARRLGLGRVSELLGDAALDADLEARQNGMTYVGDQVLASLTPELAERVDAFAEGVNEYIARAQAGELPVPSELQLASGFLGVADPGELMKPFDRRSVAGMMAVVLYESSYETGDVGRAAAVAQLDGLFAGATDEELRRQGAVQDIWNNIVPIFPVTSTPGWGLETGAHTPPTTRSRTGFRAPQSAYAPTEMVTRLADRLERFELRLLRDTEAGFGSNAWVVGGYASTDGAGLMAGDGHLSLSIPSILYHVGIDTQVLGNGNLHQLGLLIPGLPLMPLGTNGRVAWSYTQLMEDVTDWYTEEIQLLDDGYPGASQFQGSWQSLTRVDESIEVADVPALDSVGRTEVWPRWVTFDGRFIAEIEGREVSLTDPLGPGEARINIDGRYVVPSDTDSDGVISAISFNYGGFFAGGLLQAIDRLGLADNVVEFRDAARGLVSYSLNFTAADANGDILYTSYEGVPCRSYLDRHADGTWAPGSDPNLLLDGTRYGAFRIPVKDGVVDESEGASDPYACVVPFDRVPGSMSPDRGYLLTANNDPGGMSLDSSLSNDEWYVGGPWDTGARADTIDRELRKAVEEGTADIAKMAEIQAHSDSRLGELFLPYLLESIAHGRQLAASASTESEQRIAAIYTNEAVAFDEVESRLSAWRDNGYRARSGVKTFYNEPTDQSRTDAVATMIFNAWLGPCIGKVFNDEGIPGLWRPGGSAGQARLFRQMLEGRGPDNPGGLGSWNPATGESVFFDDLGTTEVESSHEILLAALTQALEFLRSAPVTAEEGGFGTTDMSQWIWGLRHQVKFESLIADFLGDAPEFAFLTNKLSITTRVLPLDEDMQPGDPRGALTWFPRHGDQWGVDAANPGFSGTRFTHGAGPVMRMVVSLKGDEVTGLNIIPGGQSGVITSDYFSDQAELWLANEALPLRFSVDDVVAGAMGHEVYHP